MPNDFKKKEPTKNEKMFYEIVMQMQDMENRVWSVSSHVLALGILTNVDPKKMAALLTGDDEQLKEYAKKVNEEIQRIQSERQAQAPVENVNPDSTPSGHDHDHNHDHNHEGHDHQH